MKLFELTFPNENICTCSDLYFRSESVAVRWEGGSEGYLHMSPQTQATFDTFFNLFSCGKYLKHTSARKIVLQLDLEGDVSVEILHIDGKVDEANCWAAGISLKRGTKQLVPKDLPLDALETKSLAVFVDSAVARRTVEVEFDISDLPDGFVYFSLKTSGGAKIFGGNYQAKDCTPMPVKVGLVICTYKREQFVKNNVANILSFLRRNPDLQPLLHIFVIDNGNTLASQDVEGATLIPNKNLGGSGGFTRGIIEVCARDGFTHVLLSDDDVVYQPEMFRKTLSLLQLAQNPDELAVGAAMMRLDRPNVQFEFGASWKKKCIHANTLHCGFDLTKQAALLKNEQLYEADYSAWWYMCMPLSKVREKGLPLPLFIKQDDIEYGARCNFEIALLNGIGLWHEPFENKYSAFLDYYSMRNLLIADCLTKRSGWWKSFWWIVTNVSIQLVYQRYFVLPYIFAACSDFLKGADFLLNTDAEQLNQKLIQSNLKQQPRDELEREGYCLDNFYVPKNKSTVFQVVSLNGYLIPTCFYPKQNRRYRVIDMRRCYPRQFFKCKKVVQFNPITQTGFVTKQRFGQLFVGGFKLLGVFFKMMFGYGKAAKSYRKNYTKLTSVENWQKFLGILPESPSVKEETE